MADLRCVLCRRPRRLWRRITGLTCRRCRRDLVRRLHGRPLIVLKRGREYDGGPTHYAGDGCGDHA